MFYFKFICLTVAVYLGSTVASDRCCPVDDPFSHKLRIMTDLQHLQPVASMEDPLSYITYITRKTDIFQIVALEKGTLIQHFQRIRKLQCLKCTKIKGFFTDDLQSFRKIDMIQRLAAIERPVFDLCDSLRQNQRSQRLTAEKGVLSNHLQTVFSVEFHRSQLQILRKQILWKHIHRGWKYSTSHRGTVSERSRSDLGHIHWERKLLQRVAAAESPCTDAGKSRRKLNCLDGRLFLKSLGSNSFNIRGNLCVGRDIAGCSLSCDDSVVGKTCLSVHKKTPFVMKMIFLTNGVINNDNIIYRSRKKIREVVHKVHFG